MEMRKLSEMPRFKITGKDYKGKRFSMYTNNRIQAEGINLCYGTKWEWTRHGYRKLETVGY